MSKRKPHKSKNKKRKHNKFFSYNNEIRNESNFMYKDFSLSNSYNSRFTCSNFNFVNFYKSTMKYCGFNGCMFNGTEFKSSNLRGSRFKGANFNDVIFLNTKLDNVNFKDSKFENVYFVNSSIKKCKGISKETPGIIIINSNTDNENLSSNLYNSIFNSLNNKFIYNSETLVSKKNKKLNHVNIKRLLNKFDESQIIKGLLFATENINNDFFTLSYLIKIIDKNCSDIN